MDDQGAANRDAQKKIAEAAKLIILAGPAPDARIVFQSLPGGPRRNESEGGRFDGGGCFDRWTQALVECGPRLNGPGQRSRYLSSTTKASLR
jgi:hypothetical protein